MFRPESCQSVGGVPPRSLWVELNLPIGRAGLSCGGATLHDTTILHRRSLTVNASISQSQIATQPEPSATVARFLKRPPRLFIGGEGVEARSQERISVVDPATGREIASFVDATPAEFALAVAAARAAFETGPWHDMLPADRQVLLWKLSDLIEKHTDELAELESINNGKTKFMATVVDVAGTRDYFRYMAGWATKIEGSTFETSIHGPPGVKFQTYTTREPIGVGAQIVPWNFPLAMAAWKLGPALATGCTSILKPAEQTPMTALRLAELKVFGQVVEGVSAAAAKIQLGPGLDPKTVMGPLVSRDQQERVLGYIESGKKEGARVLTGGEAPAAPGFFVKPTVLANVRPDMKVVREEIFGPVLVAQRFDDLDDLAALANDTPYGLGASVWSNDLRAVQRL